MGKISFPSEELEAFLQTARQLGIHGLPKFADDEEKSNVHKKTSKTIEENSYVGEKASKIDKETSKGTATLEKVEAEPPKKKGKVESKPGGLDVETNRDRDRDRP